jgi:YfiH family protein
MIQIEASNIKKLEFEIFQDLPLSHGVFLRQGGVSLSPFDSLNAGFNLGDTHEAVTENLRRVQKEIREEVLYWAKQVHGITLKEINSKSDTEAAECDGLHTDQAKVALLIKHADCQAAILYDPIRHALCVVHSGWRGTVQNIYAKAVKTMQQRYGSSPSNLLVGISPSLGPNASEFRNYEAEMPGEFWEYQIKPTYFDFWAIAKQQLLNQGILTHHIEIANICTYKNPSEYFSYRREKTTGRHATVAKLHPT